LMEHRILNYTMIQKKELYSFLRVVDSSRREQPRNSSKSPQQHSAATAHTGTAHTTQLHAQKKGSLFSSPSPTDSPIERKKTLGNGTGRAISQSVPARARRSAVRVRVRCSPPESGDRWISLNKNHTFFYLLPLGAGGRRGCLFLE